MSADQVLLVDDSPNDSLTYNCARLDQELQRGEFVGCIAASRENVQYFTGYDPIVKILNPHKGQSFALLAQATLPKVSIVHPAGEIDQALDMKNPRGGIFPYGTFYRSSSATDSYSDAEKWLERYSDPQNSYGNQTAALRAAVGELFGAQAGQILVDEDGISSRNLAEIKSMFPNLSFIEGADILRRVRAVKTAYEIEKLQKSARINEAAIEYCLNSLTPEWSELDVARCFESQLIVQGAKPGATMIKLGRHAVGGQRRPRADVLVADHASLWFDSDSVFDGYWSDIARTATIGKASDSFEGRYGDLRSGMAEGLRQVAPGMSGGDVFGIVMSEIHRCGFRDYARHHVGHGIGLEPYERPILSESESVALEENMVISLETPFYQFGVGALHIEDPFLMTAEGGKFLTKSPNPGLLELFR